MDYGIERKALYEMIADKLELFIINDTSKISQKLPSEQYLADSFGVSRPVIREALKILKERGLVEMRQGSATVISEYSAEHFCRTVRRMAQMKGVDTEQIYQIRMPLELLAVRLAAQNVTDESLLELKSVNEAIYVCRDGKERARLDVAFHKTIAKMSGNVMLEYILEGMAALLQDIFELSADSTTDRENILLHDKIFEAIEQRDAETAVDLMRTHILISMRNYEVLGNRSGD